MSEASINVTITDEQLQDISDRLIAAKTAAALFELKKERDRIGQLELQVARVLADRDAARAEVTRLKVESERLTAEVEQLRAKVARPWAILREQGFEVTGPDEFGLGLVADIALADNDALRAEVARVRSLLTEAIEQCDNAGAYDLAKRIHLELRKPEELGPPVS